MELLSTAEKVVGLPFPNLKFRAPLAEIDILKPTAVVLELVCWLNTIASPVAGNEFIFIQKDKPKPLLKLKLAELLNEIISSIPSKLYA